MSLVKIVPVSDIHLLFDQVRLPDGDILVVAGDVCGSGTKSQLRKFADWIKVVGPRYKHVIYVAGNHDRCVWDMHKAKTREFFADIPNFHYLQDDWVVLEGLVFYGSPWTPAFYQWSFMTHSVEERQLVWGKVPDKVDVLVTHGPPRGILDTNLFNHTCGDQQLLERVYQVKPQLHIFGHIHLCGGRTHLENGTIFYNAAVCNEQYGIGNSIQVIELEVP